MPASQCLGRLVRDTKGIGLLSFEEGGVFHVPFRCDSITRNGDLCPNCVEKERKTLEKVKKISGTTIQGMLPSYLNGRVTEPIPFWSRLYDGAWFRLKIESGCTLSEEVMARAKKAADIAHEGVDVVDPQPMPGGRKTRTKKGAVVPVPVPAPAEPTRVNPPPVKKATQHKKKDTSTPVAILDKEEIPVESVKDIYVNLIEVEERNLYIDPVKQKLYDLKFKYLGRLKDGKIYPFPDSDTEH